MRTIKATLIKVILALMLCHTATVLASGGRVVNIHGFSLAPNPFTPYSEYAGTDGGRGLRIRFQVETLSRFFWYTVKVHNLDGNVVRTIIELTPEYTDYDKLEPAEIILWWDGKDDYGKMAKNGRYIIHLKVSDTEAQTFSTEKIKTAVLVK